MKYDQNYIASLERAISDKYGQETVLNPKSLWNDDKEKEYMELIRQKTKVDDHIDRSKEYLDLNGVLIQKKLINSANNRKCEHCNTYSFNRDDDVYFIKYEACRKCYIKYIEDREDRWKNGWRPNKAEQK